MIRDRQNPGHAPDRGSGMGNSCALPFCPSNQVALFVMCAHPWSVRWRSQNDRKHVMELAEIDLARESHPVDVIEHVANANDWSFERNGDDEISISVAGVWTDYHLSF